ncbi:MAG: hypothetical protein RLZZ584_151 [Pseudomonadota bacterium]|jgi:hypothetical protein
MNLISRLLRRYRHTAADVKEDEAAQQDLRGLDTRLAAAMLAEIDIDTAIEAHQNWKIRLSNYLDGVSTEDLRPELVCLDDRCELGRWLHGAGNARFGGYPIFSILIARHRMFHIQASTVIALAQAGDRQRAMEALQGGYRHASQQVIVLLRELRKGVGLRPISENSK